MHTLIPTLLLHFPLLFLLTTVVTLLHSLTKTLFQNTTFLFVHFPPPILLLLRMNLLEELSHTSLNHFLSPSVLTLKKFLFFFTPFLFLLHLVSLGCANTIQKSTGEISLFLFLILIVFTMVIFLVFPVLLTIFLSLPIILLPHPILPFLIHLFLPKRQRFHLLRIFV